MAIIPLKEEQASKNEAEQIEEQDQTSDSQNLKAKLDFMEIVMELERSWAKAITHISILLLSGCVAYRFTPAEESIPQLSVLIGVLAIISLCNLFFEVLIHLSEYFNLTYQHGYQKPVAIHNGLQRLNVRVSPFWHLLPFVMYLAQFLISGHIVIVLFFC